MFKKAFTTLFSIYTKDALLRRLPASHPQRERIEQNLSIAYAGNQGERSLEFHLNFTRMIITRFSSPPASMDKRLPYPNRPIACSPSVYLF